MSLARGDEPILLRPDDVDPVTELHMRMAALETALAISDRIPPPSLRDFLD